MSEIIIEDSKRKEMNEFYFKFIDSNNHIEIDWNLMMGEVIPKIGIKYDTPCCYNIADILKNVSEFMWNKHNKNLKSFNDVFVGVYLYLKHLEE